MKIRKMTATFGCLDHAEVEFSDGVNVLVLPNESGKSTWAEFLTAMFYGLDPRRSAKGRLSHKERFQPWNGKSMEGTVELSLEGRTILLQRTSAGGKPFGVFKAYDRQTGLEISALTAENCGRTLFGVEREVFRRSAFLSGTELTVTPDFDLSRRLESLAAAGRETDSFLRADKALHAWQNRLRYHRSGEIPGLERRMQELEQAALCPIPDTTHLPPERELLRLLAGLEQTEQILETCPPALEGVEQEEILPKVQKDLMAHKLRTACAAAVAIIAAVLGAIFSPWAWIVAGASLGYGIWNAFSPKLAKSYGAAKHRDILSAAVAHRDREKRRAEQQTLIGQVRDFAPQITSLREAEQAVRDGLELHRRAAQIAAGRPDPEELEQVREQLLQLGRREEAIILARQALARANEKLQQTYVPQLTKLAGSYLQKLTLGRYDGLVMDENMELSVREWDGMLRPLAAVSSGTKDQTWLALRLAMTNLLLPKGIPLVLDDAFVTFDRQRKDAAMELLKEENRQVILFSCQ